MDTPGARIALIAPLGMAAMAIPGAGCGEDDSAPPQEAGGEATQIDARDFAFEPADASIEAGTAVRWTNTGETIHNVKGRGFFSKAIDPGASYERRFPKPGTYRYLCNLHPTTMRGTVEVAGG